jgi:hypothetical protein
MLALTACEQTGANPEFAQLGADRGRAGERPDVPELKESCVR